jgi:3D-(3,5/4)-trihydroxycyclohexane-1,2-dione acylhydrolase (decyclizing)
MTACTIEEFRQALQAARQATKTTVIVVQTDREVRVPGYESWWDVAVAETSTMDSVQQARAEYEEALKKERYFL